MLGWSKFPNTNAVYDLFFRRRSGAFRDCLVLHNRVRSSGDVGEVGW